MHNDNTDTDRPTTAMAAAYAATLARLAERARICQKTADQSYALLRSEAAAARRDGVPVATIAAALEVTPQRIYAITSDTEAGS